MKAIFKKFEHSAQNMKKKYMVQHFKPCMKSMCKVLNSRGISFSSFHVKEYPNLFRYQRVKVLGVGIFFEFILKAH